VVFDKTGTLTEDRPTLAAMRPLAVTVLDGATLRRHAAALAGWSQHPLSRALVAALGETGQPTSGGGLTDLRERAGAGVEGRDGQGRVWRLGSARWAAGLASVAVTLLSGDRAARARALAARLGIERVEAEATPEAKLAMLSALQATQGPVVMVGDGINDAPVLARADASLAMGQGALVARAQADAVVTSSRLIDLVRARERARRAVVIVRQNLVLSAVYNATCIPLALVGWLPPWAAGLGMAVSSLVVILNAQRAAR
jgi:Cu2+-exporting ATPase